MPRWSGCVVALVLVLALGVAACGSDSDSGSESSSGAASSGEPIKLGILAGLTGDSSAIGVPYVKGVELAVEELNADGGVDGRKVEIETADNKTEPVAGVQAGMKLVRTGDIDTLLCSCYSTIFFPLMNGLAKQDIAVTNDAASTPEVRELPGTIITTLPTDDVLGKALGEFAYGLGYKEASVISVNDPYGQAFTPVVSGAYEEAGGKILEEIMVEGGLPNYRPEVSRIAKAGADALLMGSYTDDARLQFKQLTEAGWDGVAFKLYPTGNRLSEDKESAQPLLRPRGHVARRGEQGMAGPLRGEVRRGAHDLGSDRLRRRDAQRARRRRREVRFRGGHPRLDGDGGRGLRGADRPAQVRRRVRPGRRAARVLRRPRRRVRPDRRERQGRAGREVTGHDAP